MCLLLLFLIIKLLWVLSGSALGGAGPNCCSLLNLQCNVVCSTGNNWSNWLKADPVCYITTIIFLYSNTKKYIYIKVSAHSACLANNLHQVRSKSKD